MTVEIALGIVLFLLGYVLGRTNLLYKKMRISFTSNSVSKLEKDDKKNLSRTNTPIIEPYKITIDETKFVTSVETESFEKEYDKFGEKIITEDNINSSISKLSKIRKNNQ